MKNDLLGLSRITANAAYAESGCEAIRVGGVVVVGIAVAVDIAPVRRVGIR